MVRPLTAVRYSRDTISVPFLYLTGGCASLAAVLLSTTALYCTAVAAAGHRKP